MSLLSLAIIAVLGLCVGYIVGSGVPRSPDGICPACRRPTTNALRLWWKGGLEIPDYCDQCKAVEGLER